MSTESNEQFRAGFEAWVKRKYGKLAETFLFRYADNEYRNVDIRGQFEAWIEAKREASTEPSAAQIVEWWNAAKAEAASYVEQHCVDGEAHARAILTQPLPAAVKVAGALTDEAKDAAILRWRIANRKWTARYRLKRGTDTAEWQMLDDGEPWGQWGDFRAVHIAAIAAHTKAGKMPPAVETMDHDQLGKLGRQFENTK